MSTVGSDGDTAVVCHARALKAVWDGGPEGRGMVLALEGGRGQAEWRVTSEALRFPCLWCTAGSWFWPHSRVSEPYPGHLVSLMDLNGWEGLSPSPLPL